MYNVKCTMYIRLDKNNHSTSRKEMYLKFSENKHSSQQTYVDLTSKLFDSEINWLFVNTVNIYFYMYYPFVNL